MARKLESDITLAIASIALKTFPAQELMVIQQVLKDFFQNSFGKVVLRPWPLLGHPTITLAIAQIRLVWLSSVSKQLGKHPLKISNQNFNPSLRYWPFLVAKVMATGPNFGHIKICSLIELPVDVLNDGAWILNIRAFRWAQDCANPSMLRHVMGKNSENFAQNYYKMAKVMADGQS